MVLGQDSGIGYDDRGVYRGYNSTRDWNAYSASVQGTFLGFRPVLEILNPDALTSGMSVVTLNLNGGKAGTTATAQGGSVNIVVKSGESFAAPSGEGLTAPEGKVFGGWTNSGTTYCKRLLKNEVIDTIRGEKRMGQREVTFSDLTRAERGQLQYIDQYAPDRRVFPLLGMEIEVLDADLVRALTALPTDRQAIILLYYFLEMRDKEIGTRLGLPRPAVQRRRTSTLDMLRKILEE